MYPKGIKQVWNFNEYGLAKVQLDNGEYTFLDTDGKLQKGRYKKEVGSYSEGLAIVPFGDFEYSFIDKEGKLQDGRYVRARGYSEVLGEVQLKGTNWAFDGSVFPEGFIDPLHGGKYAFIDKDGKLQDERYLWITQPYMEGLAGVWLEDGKATFIDKECNYYFDKPDSIKYIKKHPEYYSKIPPHRFEDEDFMENINNILNEYYTTALEKGEISANGVFMAMSTIEDKNNIVTQELQRRREEIEKIKQNIQINKQGQKEDTQLTATAKKELNSFFAKNYINNSENDDDERE